APEPMGKDHPRRDEPERPAREDEDGEESGERKPEVEEIEAEDEIGGERDRDHAHRETDHAPKTERGDEFERPQRADEEIAEIARPHLFDEGRREADLGTEQNVPEQNRADQD